LVRLRYISYNFQKEKWSLNELIRFVSTSKGKGKRKETYKPKNEAASVLAHKRNKNRMIIGYVKKKYTKYHAWCAKKVLSEVPKVKWC
jgi:hypothetical protein